MLLAWSVSFHSLSGELGAEREGRAAWSPRPKAAGRRGPKFSGRSPASASLATEAPSGCWLCEAWPWWHYSVSISGAWGGTACSGSVFLFPDSAFATASCSGQGERLCGHVGVISVFRRREWWGTSDGRGLRLPLAHSASAWTRCLLVRGAALVLPVACPADVVLRFY